MYQIKWVRFTDQRLNTEVDTLALAFESVAFGMGKKVSDLRFTDISLMGEKKEADWVVDYYGKIIAVIIKEE